MHLTEHAPFVRHAIAAGAALMAAVYVLIATNVITVMEDQATASPVPPIVAAALLGTFATALLVSHRRAVLAGGAGLQVVMILLYLLVGTERVPAFEPWGVGLKVAQLVVLALLLALLLPRRHPAGGGTARLAH